MGDGSGLVFPSPKGKAMSDNTLSKLARENDIGTTPTACEARFVLGRLNVPMCPGRLPNTPWPTSKVRQRSLPTGAQTISRSGGP